ncbi:heat shock protein DnaJ domain-containing protein [Marinobacter santoriniensis NKSG1]|uniref:Co-chaperone protein DjlA n=1 Tax=Marinobacter santoriniensis NKSG1 TaxID=1288826 RepID=M7CV43_9GAMM|nr:co-chaperone DjlA [Marinobacter santoriniensis]EMP57411.1 heat shock protein DnaJ domain-containing protein [Marinobacter santoriniensis NKSG1]
MLFAMIVGGLIGYAFGRFPGFIIGAAIGAFLFNRAKTRLIGKLQNIQSGFVESVFAVMGALCKADGVVTQDEIEMAETMFVRFRMNEQQRAAAKKAFNRGKSPDFDLDSELDHFLRISGRQPALLQMFLQVQVSAIAADGVIHPEEHQMLVRIARRLGLPDSQVDQLEAMLRGAHAGQAGGGQRSSDQQIDDAYKVLGVSASASDAEVKRAYRKLMSENHPDKLAGKGLPESMREMAEERTREISHAYDVIKEARKKAA